jgi:hypothetical protein
MAAFVRLISRIAHEEVHAGARTRRYRTANRDYQTHLDTSPGEYSEPSARRRLMLTLPGMSEATAR